MNSEPQIDKTTQYPNYTLIRDPMYAFLEALVQQMPTSTQWADEHRERWVKVLSATFDMMINGVERKE